MLADSLQALISLLKTTFPAIRKIYISTPSTGVKRPAFYIEFVNSYTQALTNSTYQTQLTWQIIYFAPVDSEHIPDTVDQLTVDEKIKTTLLDGMALTGPSGTVYHILDCEGGPRDAEVYITVRLEAEQTRPQTQYDLMQDVQNVVKS